MGSDDTHIDAALGCVDERRHHLVVQDQVGGGDVDIVVGAVDDLHIGRFGHIEVVQRTVAKGLHKPIPRHCQGGAVPVKVSFHRGGELPHHQKHQGQVPHGLPPEHHSGILPVAVLFVGVDVFIGQVQSAAVADVAVDHRDFAVIPGSSCPYSGGGGRG